MKQQARHLLFPCYKSLDEKMKKFVTPYNKARSAIMSDGLLRCVEA